MAESSLSNFNKSVENLKLFNEHLPLSGDAAWTQKFAIIKYNALDDLWKKHCKIIKSLEKSKIQPPIEHCDEAETFYEASLQLITIYDKSTKPDPIVEISPPFKDIKNISDNLSLDLNDSTTRNDLAQLLALARSISQLGISSSDTLHQSLSSIINKAPSVSHAMPPPPHSQPHTQSISTNVISTSSVCTLPPYQTSSANFMQQQVAATYQPPVTTTASCHSFTQQSNMYTPATGTSVPDPLFQSIHQPPQTSLSMAMHSGTSRSFSNVNMSHIPFSGSSFNSGSHMAPEQGSAPPVYQQQHQIHGQFGRLPRIEIPKFSGIYTEWAAFHDMFRSLIHCNNTIPSVQKLHYLKASLTDDAANLIRHVAVTDYNYEGAWNMLVRRYQNERIILFTHVQNIVSFSTIVKESASAIKNLLDITATSVNSLRNLGQPVQYWDIWLVFHVVQKLDTESKRLWEQSLGTSTNVPTFVQLQNFLESRFRTLEAINVMSATNKSEIASYGKYVKNLYVKTGIDCVCCTKAHILIDCPKFEKMLIVERRLFVRENRLCFNCMKAGHSNRKCSNHKRCTTCSGKHHSMLHLDLSDNADTSKNNQSTSKPKTDKQVQSHHVSTAPGSKSLVNLHKESSSSNITPEACSTTSVHFISSLQPSIVLLATALIKVRTSCGKFIHARALLDPGSEASFVTNSLIAKLKLPILPTNITVLGLCSSSAGTVQGSSSLQLGSIHDPEFKFNVDVLVMDSITGHLPSSEVTPSSWNHIDVLELADPNFHKQSPIDLLLGMDVYPRLLKDGLVVGPPGTPTAQCTYFGWVLCGKTNIYNSSQETRTAFAAIDKNSINNNEQIHRQLRLFWELEEPQHVIKMTNEEVECERFFDATVQRSPIGKFIVRLPFKSLAPLGESRRMAEIRLLQMEKKFARDKTFSLRYSSFMSEYISLGHMKIIEQPRNNTGFVYYLPHHAVIKEESSTTKLRVVFDASCKSTNGLSLNDKLSVGPTLQDDLVTILMRWRMNAIACSADISKMYRIIEIHKDDADFQRILWRFNPEDKIGEYQLSTVTYGTSSAAYLAIKSLRTLAQQEEATFPIGSASVLNNFYVDDGMIGADSLEAALEQQRQLIDLLKLGGFELRKWASNHPKLLEAIPIEHREFKADLNINISDTIKTLGIIWNPGTDNFGFKLNIPSSSKKPTKRSILSDIARLFDPLGWLAPIIMENKLFYQKLWLADLDWDQALPSQLESDWLRLRSTLHDITSIKIPRWISFNGNPERLELHGFADASTTAYGAVVYSRVQLTDGSFEINIIAAKSKVAPLKSVTLPKLELCAAHHLTKLLNKVKAAMHLDDVPIYAWSDSEIVLHWLQKFPRDCEVFVANRVADIQNSSCNLKWSHVPGIINPADCITRGMAAMDLVKFSLWWQGPLFLKNEEEWPNQSWKIPKNPELGMRKVKSLAIQIAPWDLVHRYSNLNKLLKITAYCLRFVRKLKGCKTTAETSSVHPDELEGALQFWVRTIQRFSFNEEYDRLRCGPVLQSRSRILSVAPFLDKYGIMRVGGRLRNAPIPYDAKHPMILDKNHHFTTLVIADAHIQTKHGGPQLTLAFTRQRFWIVDGKEQTRRYANKCMICFRNAPKLLQQLMAVLPTDRVTPARPFSRCGIDFAGPISIKSSKGRGIRAFKGYIAIFVCFVTKAIHLELVSDLTSIALLAALRRFFARRGLSNIIFSDCGTNFIKAAKEIEKDFHKAMITHVNEVAAITATDRVVWRFIPAGSPHFGGLWERGVRSVKHHLRRVLGSNSLTFEEMSTLLCEVEACLNSRPLTPITNNPDDLQPLTPGHFLIGCPVSTLPTPNYLEDNIVNRWQLLQQMLQSFWYRWSTDYMNQLQQRYKWRNINPNVVIGQLVIVKDENMPSSKWNMARILATHPGNDNLVRVVTIRCKNHVTKRAVGKLCLLPTTDNDELATTPLNSMH